MHDKEAMAKHYRDAEASFRLEGLDGSDNEDYQAMKARVIAGEIDIDEAVRLTVERYKALGRTATRQYAVAKLPQTALTASRAIE